MAELPIDNAVLCRDVLGWRRFSSRKRVCIGDASQQPGTLMLAEWQKPDGEHIEETPDFEHDIAAAMGLATAAGMKNIRLSDLSAYTSKEWPEGHIAVLSSGEINPHEYERRGKSYAQAITRAVRALVGDKAVSHPQRGHIADESRESNYGDRA